MIDLVNAFKKELHDTNLQIQNVDCLSNDKQGIQVDIARYDQIDHAISGNKAFKLLPHLKKAQQQGNRILISFGGMFSNHLHALAFAGKRFGFKTIGIVRAYEGQPESITLQEARLEGMHITKVNKHEYQKKHDISYQQSLLQRWPGAYIIPEGGGGVEGIEGVSLMPKLLQDVYHRPIDYLVLPVGTGTTFAGFIRASQSIPIFTHTNFIGIAALRDLDNITKTCQHYLSDLIDINWQTTEAYCFGGFAKVNVELAKFMLAFEKKNGVLLDPVYTAKMFYAVRALLEQDFFKPQSSIVCIHTGGVQGRRGLIEKIVRLAKV